MDSTQYDEKISEMEKSLRYISHIIKQRGREILQNYPITPPQFIALQWLRELGDLTIGELSKKMYLAFSTTTDLVDRMEKNDLIMRVRDPKDRRVVQIHLLEKGSEIIHEVILKRHAYLSEILTTYSDEEVAKLHQTMAQLHGVMKSQEQDQE